MDGPRAAAVCKGQGWPGWGILELGQEGPEVGHRGGCEDKAGSWMIPWLFVQPHALQEWWCCFLRSVVQSALEIFS